MGCRREWPRRRTLFATRVLLVAQQHLAVLHVQFEAAGDTISLGMLVLLQEPRVLGRVLAVLTLASVACELVHVVTIVLDLVLSARDDATTCRMTEHFLPVLDDGHHFLWVNERIGLQTPVAWTDVHELVLVARAVGTQ